MQRNENIPALSMKGLDFIRCTHDLLVILDYGRNKNFMVISNNIDSIWWSIFIRGVSQLSIYNYNGYRPSSNYCNL